MSNSKSNNPNDRDTNIMVQMNLYDKEKITNQIMDLEDVYHSQLKRLRNLKEEDPEKCIDRCTEFLDDNEETINRQLDTIVELERNIKIVVEDCENIENQEEKLNSMIQEPKYVNMAEKIKKMKSTIDNLNNFLVKKKILSYKN